MSEVVSDHLVTTVTCPNPEILGKEISELGEDRPLSTGAIDTVRNLICGILWNFGGALCKRRRHRDNKARIKRRGVIL